MSTYSVLFTTPGTDRSELGYNQRRPGWTVIEDCVDMNDAINFFLDNRGQHGIPADAEIDTVHIVR